ncbi:hypothetical protein LG71_25745 [Pluralibacter gergoviae]|uniref:hypothetical protein n=1 Tax=Pluralibacter gergoviae TaxID=61647 RepID=UPI00078E4259|nr:hypothetical protein [Pluralibacter gergoviae]AMR39173.1 hypothetical protein LG71_25745 [Pluralibacter gergoviae]
MAAQKEETIWQKNNMPPLEFCTLERASRLLGCEVDDLWHWQDIGVLRFSTKLQKTQMGCGVFHPDELDCASLSDEEQKTLLTHALLSLGRNQKGFNFSYLGEPTLISQAINVNVECCGVFCFEMKIDRSAPDEWYSKGFSRVAESKLAIIFIRGDIPQMELNEKDLLIIRDDIEAIYSAIATGEFVRLEPESGIKAPRVTVHQSGMILSLLKIAGLSDDDIFHTSPANLNKKIAQLAASKGVNAPQPDKDTWAKWRGRFR